MLSVEIQQEQKYEDAKSSVEQDMIALNSQIFDRIWYIGSPNKSDVMFCQIQGIVCIGLQPPTCFMSIVTSNQLSSMQMQKGNTGAIQT